MIITSPSGELSPKSLLAVDLLITTELGSTNAVESIPNKKSNENILKISESV